MNKGSWMAKGTGFLNDGELAYEDSSRIEPKRAHQWFLDGTEANLFPNKKHAVGVPSRNSFSELLNSNITPWGNASSFHSATGQYSEPLFNPEAAGSINFDDRNIHTASTGNIIMGRTVNEDSFGTDSSVGLSIAHRFEDPRSGLNYGGIRKVKVSQVKESENFMPASLGQVNNVGDNTAMSTPQTYSEADDNSISMGLSCSRGNDKVIAINDAYNRLDNNFISMGQPYNKAGDNTISMGHPYKEDNNAMLKYFSNGSGCIKTMGQNFFKEDDNNISMRNTFEDNSISITMGQSDNSMPSMGQTVYQHGKNISMGNSNEVDGNAISMGHTYNKVENNSIPTGNCFGKGESNIISFGGFQDDGDINSSGRLISYDLLTGQSSTERPEAPHEKGLVDPNVDAVGSASNFTSSTSGTVSKKKEDQKGSKKVSSNNFPSNVRSLLSTGMLDGVPVKYLASSREKELRGIIEGSGYLCGCQSCNLSKAITAYEFERHAGCKTKHPNNHIYFENGKTIYGIVQELKNTPQNMLFEVMQTITGSPINQKSFRLWKESFLAATRELQRIYGKDEGKHLSQSQH